MLHRFLAWLGVRPRRVSGPWACNVDQPHYHVMRTTGPLPLFWSERDALQFSCLCGGEARYFASCSAREPSIGVSLADARAAADEMLPWCQRRGCEGKYRDSPGHQLYHENNDRWRGMGQL